MSLPIWGALCDGATTPLLGASWHLTYYLSGGLAVLWSALWMCVARSSPMDDPAASAAEKRCAWCCVSVVVIVWLPPSPGWRCLLWTYSQVQWRKALMAVRVGAVGVP